ncbi:MAG: sulfatase [Deltaproteobacteria bacterium]|nr:sulfatase [Deltaproteobacteria bacterium]
MDRPNLVLIVMDTVRARNLRAYGYGRETTPHLDRFLAEATVYRDATSPSPWTLPAHASMFTGRMPSQHGAHENHRFLDAEVPHLAELLRVAGYETVGLSSNSWISNTFGTSRGFERFFKVWQLVQSDQDLHRVHVEDQWQKWRETVAQLTGRDFFRNLANGVYQRFLADGYDKGGRRIGRWVRRWAAERDGKRPFFLFVNLMEAHLKYLAPAPWRHRFTAPGVDAARVKAINQDPWAHLTGRAPMTEADFRILEDLYDGELLYLDQCLEELFAAFRQRGWKERTLVAVTSDHGENIGDHGRMDHQYCLYDTLLRVPLIVRYPDDASARGRSEDAPVQTVDVFPTLLEAAGVAVPAGPRAPGSRSLRAAPSTPDRVRVAEYLGPEPRVESIEARYPGFRGDVLRRSLRAVQSPDGWKWISASDGAEELYHLGADPREERDRSSDERAPILALRQALTAWEAEAGGERETGDEPEIDEAVRKRLEALGYL